MRYKKNGWWLFLYMLSKLTARLCFISCIFFAFQAVYNCGKKNAIDEYNRSLRTIEIGTGELEGLKR